MINPVVLAAIGVIVTLVAYTLAGKISNRILRGLAQLASVLITLALVGLMSASPEIAGQAGQYYFIGIVIAFILGKIFGGSNRTS